MAKAKTLNLNNLLKISGVVGIALISIAALFYFFVFVPQREERIADQAQMENQIKCKKAGDEYVSMDEKNLPYGSVIAGPQYKFSQKLHTCLYKKEVSIFWADGKHLAEDYSIIDIYSNTVIVNWFRHYSLADEVNATRGSEADYKALSEEYFN